MRSYSCSQHPSITITNTDVHTVTKVIPVTITEEIDYTVNVPMTSRQTVTAHSTVVVTESEVHYTSQPLGPTTVVVPTSVTHSPLPPINQTTGQPPVSTAGANSLGPAAALAVGILGGLALF